MQFDRCKVKVLTETARPISNSKLLMTFPKVSAVTSGWVACFKTTVVSHFLFYSIILIYELHIVLPSLLQRTVLCNTLFQLQALCSLSCVSPGLSSSLQLDVSLLPPFVSPC